MNKKPSWVRNVDPIIVRWVTYAIILSMLALLLGYVIRAQDSIPDLIGRVSLALIAISLVATLGLALSSLALSNSSYSDAHSNCSTSIQ